MTGRDRAARIISALQPPAADPRDEALDIARGKLQRIAMGWERDPSVGADEALVMIRELLERQPEGAPGPVEDEGVFELAAIIAANPIVTNPDLARIILADPRFAWQPQPAPEVACDHGADADLETLADARIQVGVLQDEIGELRRALRQAVRHVEPVDQNSELAIARWLALAGDDE